MHDACVCICVCVHVGACMNMWVYVCVCADDYFKQKSPMDSLATIQTFFEKKEKSTFKVSSGKIQGILQKGKATPYCESLSK